MNAVDQLIASRPGFAAMEPANQTEAVPLGGNIFMSGGTSNAYLVRARDSRVIINTGLGFEAITHKRLFDTVCDLPTSHILVTQGHVDHVGGVARFREPGTLLIAQANNRACQRDDERIHAIRVSQSAIWFQKTIDRILAVAAEHPDVLIQDTPTADITFDERYSLEIGGVRFELYATPGGETIDSCVIWLPEQQVLFSGNMFGPLFPHFPNFNTIRGDKYRDPQAYLESLALVRSLAPQTLITGHFEPIIGAQLIRDALDRLERAVAHVYRETLAGMNAGRDIFSLMREIELPPEHSVGQGYGKVSWAVRTVWEQYMGWFRAQSTTELYPTQASDIYPDLLQLAGFEALLARGRSRLDAGDAEAALHFAEVALSDDGREQGALQLALDCHLALAARVSQDNFWEAGWLRAEIDRLQRALSGH